MIGQRAAAVIEAAMVVGRHALVATLHMAPETGPPSPRTSQFASVGGFCNVGMTLRCQSAALRAVSFAPRACQVTAKYEAFRRGVSIRGAKKAMRTLMETGHLLKVLQDVKCDRARREDRSPDH